MYKNYKRYNGHCECDVFRDEFRFEERRFRNGFFDFEDFDDFDDGFEKGCCHRRRPERCERDGFDFRMDEFCRRCNRCCEY